MVDLSDEKLMAFVDGKLDDHESNEIRHILETNAEARERVELLKKSTPLLQAVYDAPVHEEVPEYLVEGIVNYRDRAGEQPGLWDRFRSRLQIDTWQPAHILAFSMIFMIGIGTGWFAAGLSRPERMAYAPGILNEKLSRGLETTVSGMGFSLKGQRVRVTPVNTFVDKQGRYCRQYEVTRREDGQTPLSYGVACRIGKGKWLPRVTYFPEPSEVATPAARDSYIPASEDDPAATLFSDLMGAPPLTIEQEKDLIRSRWHGKK